MNATRRRSSVSAIGQIQLWSVLLSALLFLTSAAFGEEEPCDGCKRSGLVSEVKNTYLSTIETRLAECLTGPCFKLQHRPFAERWAATAAQVGWRALIQSGRYRPPEYHFTAAYEPDLDGAIKSRMSVRLYCRTGELVKEWASESERPTFTFKGHLNRLFDNPGAILRKVDIPDLLADFERRPVRCDIFCDPEHFRPGEKGTITLRNFLDASGRPAKGFNRIVVATEEGVLLTGAILSGKTRARAFTVADAPIEIEYRAGDILRDIVKVYDSCEIFPLDMVRLEHTPSRKVIARHTIEYVHAGWSGSITIVESDEFECGTLRSKQSGWVETKEITQQQTELRIQMTGGQLPEQPKGTGRYSRSYLYDYFYEIQPPSVVCKKKTVHPGNRITEKTRQTTDFNTTLKGDSWPPDIGMRGEPAGWDPPGEYKIKMSVKVRKLDGKQRYVRTRYREEHDRCKGTTDVKINENDRGTEDLVSDSDFFSFPAVYTKKKDGHDTIMATIQESETTPATNIFGQPCKGRKIHKTYSVDLKRQPE